MYMWEGGIYNNCLELTKSQKDIDKMSALAPGTYYQVLSKLWLLGHLVGYYVCISYCSDAITK